MKFRSFLLFACMVGVPSMAMFSHKIPPSLRHTLRDRFWDPVKNAVMSGLDGEAVAASMPPPPAAVIPVAARPPHAAGAVPSAALAVKEAIPAEAPRVRSLASERKTVEIRLAELGAFAFDCAPLADSGGLHRCSCRVAADASGQLQRVFQAADRDPVAAMQNLLGQVRSWKERLAVSPAPDASPLPLSGTPSQALRF